jgi:hypothetical protein
VRDAAEVERAITAFARASSGGPDRDDEPVGGESCRSHPVGVKNRAPDTAVGSREAERGETGRVGARLEGEIREGCICALGTAELDAASFPDKI